MLNHKFSYKLITVPNLYMYICLPWFECTGVAFKVLVLKEIKSKELPKMDADKFMGYLNLVSLPAEVHTIDEGDFT